MAINLIEYTKNHGTQHIHEIDGIYLSLKDDLKFAEITTIIPAKGRGKQLKCTLDHLKKSSNFTDQNISILVIEISEEMEHLHVCRDLQISYVWLHQSPDKKFNKCLAHNIGWTLSHSKLLHFHDSDIVMDSNFYELFKGYRLDELSALHCLKEKYVRYLSPEETDFIFEGNTVSEMLSVYTPTIPETKNAPGGSILIGRTLFDLIGGFDSHLFVGYSAEDQFFWDKVSNIVSIQSMNDNEMYHLHHDSDRTHLNSDHLVNLTAFDELKPKSLYYQEAKRLLYELKKKINELQGA